MGYVELGCQKMHLLTPILLLSFRLLSCSRCFRQKIDVAVLLIPVLEEFFLCFNSGRKKHFPGYHLVKNQFRVHCNMESVFIPLSESFNHQAMRETEL